MRDKFKVNDMVRVHVGDGLYELAKIIAVSASGKYYFVDFLYYRFNEQFANKAFHEKCVINPLG